MASDWIDEGLRHAQERAEQRRLASERRHHQTSVIKRRGPDLMRGLLAEVGAIIDEYRRKADPGGNEIEFEALPHEGFCVTKTTLPRVGLECRPDYEAHVLYCNMTRTGDQESDPVELVFSLYFTVDESDNVELRHGTRPFRSVNESVEFLLKPVLFPLVDQQL
jgi:hypothetical protein